MMDRTTRWPEAVAIPDVTADTILQAFLNSWVTHFGVPKVVTSDRGAQFTLQAWSNSLSRLGISVSYNYGVPPAAKRPHRAFSPLLQKYPEVRCHSHEVMDPIAPVDPP